MHKYALVALVRVILPAGLLLSIALRPFGLSLVYLFLFLLAPLANVPDSRSFRGGKFILLILVLSWLLLSLHLVWHGVLFGFAPYGSLLSEHKIIETIGLNLGLVSYQDIDSYMAVHYLAPELVMCGVSLSVYLITKKVSAIVPDEDHKKDRKHQQYPALVIAGKYISLFLIMFSGIMRPSVTSAIYFLVFMGVATAWAVGRPLGKAFAVISRCLMGIMAAHIAGLLVYQCTWLIQLYPPDRDMARYFGLTKLVMINETSPNSFVYEVIEDKKWATLANPLVILFTYYVLALESRELFKPKPKKRSALTGAEAGQLNGSLLRGLSFHHGSRIAVKDKWKTATKKVRVAYSYINSQALRGNPSENIPLMRGMSPSKRWSSVRSAAGNRPLHQDSKGSVVVLDDEDSFTEEVAPTLVDEIVAAIFELFQVLIRSSYIATTITMMAWSIMFHSWLAFVFLMWANIVWLCHDQRSFMLKTSPILVCYAMILLLTQYMYGMDLTEAELPSNITEVNLAQLGLLRPVGEPCVPLLIKSLFTCMFWVTLRQRVQEIRQRRRSAVITDMAAPLQLTVSTAASGVEAQREEEDRSRLLKKFGDFLRFLCARYWIYVVVIMLFVIGITGKRMTIFRIIYMFLFLTFILVFQTSWYWWRRLMYVFWITLIIYSMVNLILIYIYQFDNFSKTIEQYLLINQKLQHDLGLEPYHPADLFVKLLTPTLFLIITIMQVHYFHKDFMELSDPKTSFSRSNSVPRGPDSSRPSQAGASTMRDDLPPLSMEGEQPSSPSQREGSTPRDQNFTVMHYERTSESMKRGLSQSYAPTISERRKSRLVTLYLKHLVKLRIRLQNWMENMFMYLDIHLVKVIFVALMLLCVVNVCAMHVPIMIMIAPALWLSSSKQRFCVLFISALISLYFMAKMVYQIEYIQHSMFDVNCTTSGFNDTVNTTVYNNAEWLGFIKSSKQKPLVVILKGYIGLIALFTFYSLVTYRQQALRSLGVLPPDKYKTMFADITRKDADKDVVHCLKFFVNYGFYKFGIEVCLICLMGVIGSRMDVCAVLYAGWLLTLVSMTRTQLAKIWPVFTTFVTILVPLQYMIAVGFLPQLCIDYPWDRRNEQWSHIRRWLFLPFADDPPYAMKLIFDYLLLLFATRQIRVFYVEKTRGDNYPGGSNNEDTGLDWETPTFVNPVPDFLGYVGTWLDVVKRLVFLGMLWVTLAIMFMTGTNRVNLFSMGYLVGSFIFLWQGTDFYLRPKETILRWWSWLIRYNVSVVVIKALLQIPGCMFSSLMQEHACWMVQLLGIGCVDKFEGNTFKTFLKMKQVKGDVCPVPQEDIGLAWDGVCFAFLILQRRLFHSYYFYRVIDESKATTVLASRGAELIEQLRQKQMHMQEEAESKILDKIKIKMERIKANQKKIRGTLEKDPKHHDAEEDEDTQPGESEGVPLVRGDSDVSGRGYHTPDSPASPRGFHTPISEPSAPPSPERTHPPPPQPLPLPAIPPPSSQGGPPSPSSALMTVSLDAYLEPRRISFESPPNSEFLPRAQSPEESYPVFSPPPIRRRHTVASPSILQRTSIISQSSRAEPNSHHTSVRSGDYYMFDEFDDMDSHDLLMKEESEEDKDAPDKKMGLGELLSAVLKTDLKRAVSMRRASMPAVRTTRHSIGSFPASYPHEGRRSPPGEERRINTDISMSGREPDDAASDLDEYADMPEHETALDKLKRLLDTLWAFIASMIVSVTRYVMRYSRDYRYVSRTLSIEKKILKEREGFGIGLREGSNMIWEPLPEMLAHNRKLSDISVPEIRILAPSMERGLDASPPPARSALADRDSSADSYRRDDDDTSEHESAFSLQTTSSKDVTTLEEQDDSIFKKNQSPFVQLGYAVWFAILAHTDIVCYITVFINQIQSATILSIPLPLMVFLWGTLTIPRPTKTFWVTLIAYTEVIVLIKSMFQFEILPWNQKATPDNTPFTAPRIIGIERKVNYALYDLLLLLIIFLHRFMLKSLGLWKESTPEIELREDVEYYLTKEDTDLVVQGRGDEVGQKYVELHDRQGPRHRLVDRLYHVQATIAEAVRELGTSRSDPRIATVVWEKLRNQQPTQRGTAGRGHATLRDIVSREIIRRRTVAGDLGITLDKQKTVVVRETDDLEDDDVGKDNEPGPSKPSGDDEHFLVNNEREPIIAVTTILEDKYKHFPNVMLLSFKRYLRPTQVFFKRMLAQGARVTADVYAYMFLCDFFNFLVVIFGFAAFGTHQGDGGVQAYLEENKVPIPFLVMLILQFGLIIIDRALYLRKFILGKILFQYGLIVGVHIWMFFVLPFITERTFNMRWPPPIWYMIKCIYLLLSAYQIRCGYPRRIIGNFLCKSYRFVNMLLFRGFMAVPFVFELRTLMDWIWTDTSMTLMDWLKMEDIFASVFLLKCSRYVEDEFPQPRGVKKSPTAKYLLGGAVLAFVIAIIWFPLVFFAFGNSVGKSNPPTDVTVKIRIGPFLPVYQMSAQKLNIDILTEQDYTQLSNNYVRDRTAQTFLSNYVYDDVAVISLNTYSTAKWMISPPELKRLEDEVVSNASLSVKFTYIITHPTNAVPNPPTLDDNREVSLVPFLPDGKRNPERDKLLMLLNGTAAPDTWLHVHTLFPKFLKVFNKGSTKPADQLMPDATTYESRMYRDVQLRLDRDDTGAMFWRVREFCTPGEALMAIPLNNCNKLVLYTFNDKLFPETLNFISGSGIIGLYTTFVFLASRVLRGFFSGIYTKIMFDDLPNVDRVLQLCLDIYLVREALELSLEEDLFAKLVFLYRSPETMIKWSRPKEEELEPQRALPPSL